MTNEETQPTKRREPGKRVFTARDRPQLVLVPPAQPNRPAPKVEHGGRPLSHEVKEMLREMNRRHAATRSTDTPDAA